MFLTSLFSRMIFCPSEQFCFRILNFFPSDSTLVPNKSLVLLAIFFLLYLTPRWHKYFVSPSHVHIFLCPQRCKTLQINSALSIMTNRLLTFLVLQVLNFFIHLCSCLSRNTLTSLKTIYFLKKGACLSNLCMQKMYPLKMGLSL